MWTRQDLDTVMAHPVNKQQRKFGPLPGTVSGKGVVGAYPEVTDELLTLKYISEGRSIARLGDGELNIAMGGSGISQREVPPEMRKEMLQVLANPGKCLVGIPNPFSRTPKKQSWLKYATKDVIAGCMLLPKYVSSFITRPDSAPWIDTPAFWSMMRGLWRNKEVTLVYGGPTSKSLQPEWLLKDGARIVHPILGKRSGAYCGIDELEGLIGKPKHPVLLCLGPTATILAWRLAQKGVWAMDLGHVGMFINAAGSFNLKNDSLVTEEYRGVLAATHEKYKADGKPWGVSGRKFSTEVVEFYRRLGADTLLDYGCGQQTLKDALQKFEPPIRVMGYDPGIPEKAALPKPCCLVTCTEVMEHVEPEKITDVVGHINSLALKGAFFTISCDTAGEILADGRNAHLVVEEPEYWLQVMRGWDNWYIDNHHYDAIKKRIYIWMVRKGTVVVS